MMHNMDVLIKLPAIVSGNRLSILYKIAFVWISTPESLSSQSSHVQQHNEHIRPMKFIIHMHVKKNQPILVRVLQACQTFLFFTWNFVNRLKQTFLQKTFSLLADRAHQNSATIDWFVENWEACSLLAPCGSRIVKFLIHDWFVR